MKNLYYLALLLTCFTLISCGKKKNTDTYIPAPQKMIHDPEGTYRATLAPIGKDLENLSGKVTISKLGDEFKVHIKLRNGTEGLHVQGFYSGRSCESEDTVGRLIIPFDGDLSGRDIGNEYFPQSANYEYERSTSYSLMLSDLPEKDRNLILDGRVIYIKGQNIGEACGVLRSTTSVIEEDEEEPEVTPIRVQPRPEPKPEPRIEPEPEAPVYRRTVWGRVRDRLGSWWRRIRGRGP